MPWMIHQVPTSRVGVGRRLGGSYTRENDRATHRVTVGRLRLHPCPTRDVAYDPSIEIAA
jgi:hypothetical protein